MKRMSAPELTVANTFGSLDLFHQGAFPILQPLALPFPSIWRSICTTEIRPGE
jgi:hypothetical protein